MAIATLSLIGVWGAQAGSVLREVCGGERKEKWKCDCFFHCNVVNMGGYLMGKYNNNNSIHRNDITTNNNKALRLNYF